MDINEEIIRTKIKEQIRYYNSDAEVLLFGSHARGDYHKDSDWDILILLNQANVCREDEKTYRDLLFDVELETGEAISTFVFSKSDWINRHSSTPFYSNIARDGVLL